MRKEKGLEDSLKAKRSSDSMKASLVYKIGRKQISYDLEISSENSSVLEYELKEIVNRAKIHEKWILENGGNK